MTETVRTVSVVTKVWQTLRFRFAVMTGGLLLLALGSFGAFVYVIMAHSLSAAVDEALRLNAAQALTAVDTEGGQLELPDSFVAGPETATLRGQGLVLRILNSDGQALRDFGAYQSLPVTEASVRSAQQGDTNLVTLIDPTTGDAVRLYTVPISSNGRTMGIYQVGQSLAGVNNTLGMLLRALLIGGPALIVVAGLGGYLLAARALAPIDRITQTARRISAEDLSARLDVSPIDDEIGRLAATLNDMLARLKDAFEREKQFTADASHELRTPLAAMQTILDVIRERRRTPDEYEQALDDLAEETRRLSQLTENLLLLARENGQDAFTREAMDLSILLVDISDSMRPLAEKKGLTLICDVPERLTIIGNTDGLIRVFANLIDNAIKYSEHGQITITARSLPDRRVEISVRDTGVGIPPEHLPRVFERFYRVEESRTSDGIGLGLAIVQRILHAHGGSIDVDSDVSSGTIFTVRLQNSH